MEKADLGTDAHQGTGDGGLHPQLRVNPGFSHQTASHKTLSHSPWGSCLARAKCSPAPRRVNWITRPHRSPAGNSGPLGPPIPLQSHLLMDYYFITLILIEKLLSFSIILATSPEVTTVTLNLRTHPTAGNTGVLKPNRPGSIPSPKLERKRWSFNTAPSMIRDARTQRVY